jgi:hypothetical protein
MMARRRRGTACRTRIGSPSRPVRPHQNIV